MLFMLDVSEGRVLFSFYPLDKDINPPNDSSNAAPCQAMFAPCQPHMPYPICHTPYAIPTSYAMPSSLPYAIPTSYAMPSSLPCAMLSSLPSPPSKSPMCHADKSAGLVWQWSSPQSGWWRHLRHSPLQAQLHLPWWVHQLCGFLAHVGFSHMCEEATCGFLAHVASSQMWLPHPCRRGLHLLRHRPKSPAPAAWLLPLAPKFLDPRCDPIKTP